MAHTSPTPLLYFLYDACESADFFVDDSLFPAELRIRRRHLPSKPLRRLSIFLLILQVSNSHNRKERTFELISSFDRRYPAIEQTPHRIVLSVIAGSFLLQFTKLVIGLSQSVMGAAIKNTDTAHPGRRFLAASQLHSRSKNSLNRQAIAG